MVRKTKEEAQATHDRILKAAVDVFYEKGVERATLENIASAAGLTRGAIYWHFKNKLDLFTALHDRMHNEFMQQLLESKSKAAAYPLKELSELCIQTLLQLESDKDQKKTLTIFMVKADYKGDMAPFLKMQNKQKNECMDVVKDFFERAKELGQISAQSDCDTYSLLLWFLMSGIMGEYLRDNASVNIKHHARPLIEQFFKTIV